MFLHDAYPRMSATDRIRSIVNENRQMIALITSVTVAMLRCFPATVFRRIAERIVPMTEHRNKMAVKIKKITMPSKRAPKKNANISQFPSIAAADSEIKRNPIRSKRTGRRIA
jgi:hypothetical protein